MEELIKEKFKIDDRNLKIIQIIMMFGLIITMCAVGFVIFKYGSVIKSNPCDYCTCTMEMVKNWNYGYK